MKKYSSDVSSKSSSNLNRFSRRCILAGSFLAASAAVLVPAAAPAEVPQDLETLSNIPQTLSGECSSAKDCKKPRIQRPKSRKAESCTIKCVTTCIRGGDGSPGEGPFNIRRPLVVFKEGFRSRNYWYDFFIPHIGIECSLVECSDICNLIGDGDDGP
ncbi:checkpoint serine/threonine-protein kinase BUB1-like [Hibiscus syriacus]|uniref:Checkpoint serine/threonine-protein kinase BUB1-like n=1 Tax=Hibiscus syriacus TaxID=106335 RepID=A0A6A2WLT3_HIBSY|nr:checkpoint serine/threonine-protein kinase BUB1-like [Hibiscus syriacus]